MTVHKEFRIFGPPGTGKTTYLTHQINAAIEKHGLNKVLAASFTKAASQELISRNQEASDSIGTLHAHCYRAIGHREIAENHIDEFNENFPQFKLTKESGKVSVEDIAADVGNSKTQGDEFFHKLNLYRARLTPPENWSQNIREFSSAWQIFKKSSHYIDFTDMIDIAYEDIDIAPGNPEVGFFDEAQDFSGLEFALVRKCAKAMEYIVICGDDDQLLYSWLGASTDVFLQGTPDVKKVLSQSYRVPIVIHKFANEWIQQVKNREPKEYKPRNFEGEIRKFSGGNYKQPRGIIQDAEQYISQGKSVMFLASCSYMLTHIVYELRQAGIPFHNPYREKQGAWNPIKRRGKEGDISAVDRLLAYLAGCPEIAPVGKLWTSAEFKKWITIIKSDGNLKRGIKKKLDDRTDSFFELGFEELSEAFIEESSFWNAYNNFSLDTALAWFQGNVNAQKSAALRFPIQVIKKTRDYNCFDKPPQCIVGTIHSTKGGEADVVYLLPDMSLSGMQGYIKGGETKDSVTRMFYVGITRARESLILCQGATNYSVVWGM